MKTPPQSTWDHDPDGTYRKMMSWLDEDEKNGYLVGNVATRLRDAAGKCYLKAKRRQR